MRLYWLPRAIRDRDAQINYIAANSPKAAIAAGDRLSHQVDQLVKEPTLSGRVGRRQGTRELVISRTPWIVVFRVRPKVGRIEILRVLHSSQRYPGS